ncbi:MAG: glycosyltransferase family protein [Verrucomicrobia bacterium]|nr:glycosyltransferase family protein [Verrucomicrobiota bacterium]
MKIVVIIQARMGSSRFPGKMLELLADRPVIEWVYDRARTIPGLDAVVVATTTTPADDQLADHCRLRGIPVFRGSENDVLDRYYQAAKELQADMIMRITGDCPFLDPQESRKVVDAYLQMPDCDYASNNTPPTYPDGLDTEAVSFQALEWMWKNAHAVPYREHVTYYIRSHQDQFRVAVVKNTVDLSAHRWTLDEKADYIKLSTIAEKLGRRKQFGSLYEILAVLYDNPDIDTVNRYIGRDEGLEKSLREHPV